MLSRFPIAILLAISINSIAISQQYAVTPFQGFGLPLTDNVTSTNVLDSSLPSYSDTIYSDHSSMSPDSWSMPSSQVSGMPMLNSRTMDSSGMGMQPSGMQSTNNNDFPANIPASNSFGNSPNPGSIGAGATAAGATGSGTTNTGSSGQSPFRQASFGAAIEQLALGSQSNLPQTIPGQGLTQAVTGQTLNRPYSVYPLLSSDKVPSNIGNVQSSPNMNQAFGTNQALGTNQAFGMNQGRFVPATSQSVLSHSPGIPNSVMVSPNGQMGNPYPVFNSNAAMPNFGMGYGQSNFRPDLGHRSPEPTIRNFGTYDEGQKFDFEDKKKEYPGLGEIFATGRYFGSASLLYLRPHFQNNTAFTTNSATFGENIPFDYDFEAAPYFRFGFESKFGPGVEIDYMQYDEASNPASFTARPGVTADATTRVMRENPIGTIRGIECWRKL